MGVLKFFGTNIYSGLKRKRAPEDEARGITNELTKQENDNTRNAAVFDEEMRWKRIIINDLENIPITLALMWAAVAVRATNEAIVGLASAFVFARVGHTVCYVYKLMPWRSIIWFIGFAASLGFAILIPIA